jgi:hypothetical protein
MGCPAFFRRKRHVMPPITFEITAGGFALAAGHRRIAISFRGWHFETHKS